MEDVLDLYAEPPDPLRPLVTFDERPVQLLSEVCEPLLRPLVTFDERPVQLLSEVCEPLPCRPGRARREDYEYQREGTCNIFSFFAPHEGWRHMEVTEQRTAVDFAHQMKWLADVRYPQAEVIRIVLDNLNIHTPASLYQAFSPEEARRLAKKLEFHPTPKHASWLNMNEVELAVLSRQCLARRLGSRQEVAREIAAWEEQRNAAGATVTWRFTTTHARSKLSRLYPKLDA